MNRPIKLIPIKSEKEQSNLIKPMMDDDTQLAVKFKDGKLIHMSVLNHNGELQLPAPEMSLIEEIKILIRKLWN